MRRNGQEVKKEGYITDIITNDALDWLKHGRDQSKPFLLMVQHKAPHREWLPGPDQLSQPPAEPFPGGGIVPTPKFALKPSTIQ